MKKRFICMLLLAALLLTAVPGARAETTLCFVAMNDTVPLTLTDGAMPYYNKGKLYLPYTAFRVNPNRVGASYNAEKGTFVLFNSSEMLIFDLENETYTDSKEDKYEVDLAYRGGLLYIPASVASHFDLSVTMLTSRAGYPIIRFTNGGQVYDDGMFVAQAENLITHVAQEYEHEGEAQVPVTGIDPPQEPEEERGPVEVYLAFAGEAVAEETVRKLAEYNIRAAFFLTEEQMSRQPDLVRAIYAGGHTVGLTASGQGTELRSALTDANEVMDSILFCKSVFAMFPEGSLLEDSAYHMIAEPKTSLSVEAVLAAPEEPHFYVVRSGALGVIESFVNAGATLPQLLETTF